MCLTDIFFYPHFLTDHPYIQPKYGSDVVQFNGNSPELNSPIPGYSPFQHGQLSPVEESLHLHLSVSDEEQSTSCDSFVTCDGEVGPVIGL